MEEKKFDGHSKIVILYVKVWIKDFSFRGVYMELLLDLNLLVKRFYFLLFVNHHKYESMPTSK